MHTKRQHLRAGLIAAPEFRRFKGGGDTTTTSSGPPAQVLANYQQVYNQAQNVANQPYQPYSGSTVAGFTPMQQQGFNAVNTAANAGQPFINQASQDVTNSTTALNGQNFGNTVSQYQSPYTQQVVNATTAQMNNQDAIQQNQLAGNAASAGAFGGDRQGVAQAVLGGQQATANNATLANLNNTGFQNATSAAQSNAWLNSQGAAMMGNLGTEAQTQGETAANSMLSAGQTQQTQAQNELNVPYESYLAAQAYPFQTTNYLANIAEGTGSLSGGTSSTTSPGTSILSQGSGLGLAGAGIYSLLSDKRAKTDIGKVGSLNDGTPVYRFRYKGDPHFQIGLIAQNVKKHHPDAVHQSDSGLLGVDYREATQESLRRKAGGFVPLADGGTPSSANFGSGVPDFSISLIPSGSSSQAHGSTIPQAPHPQQDTSLQSELGAMGSLGKSGDLKGLGGDLKNLGSQIGGWFNGTNPDDASSLFGMSSGMQNTTNAALSDAALPTPDFGYGLAARGGAIDFGAPRRLQLGIGDVPFPRRARGGFMPLHRDDGGAAMAPAGLTASVGGNPAMVQLTQAYSGLPTEQLQEMASRASPNSPQGSMAQRALRMRQMNPQSNPAQPSVPTGMPSGQAQQQAGFGPAQGFADGGAPVGDPYDPNFDVTPAVAAMWQHLSPSARDRVSTDLGSVGDSATPNIPSVDLRGVPAAIAGMAPLSSDSPATHAAYTAAGQRGMAAAGMSPSEQQDIIGGAPSRDLSGFTPSDFAAPSGAHSTPGTYNNDIRLNGGLAPRVGMPDVDRPYDVPQPDDMPNPDQPIAGPANANPRPSAMPFGVGQSGHAAARTPSVGGFGPANDVPPVPPIPPSGGAPTDQHPIINVQKQGGFGSQNQQPRDADTGQFKPNVGEALLAAGLSMMAGKSPHAMVNIGSGGLAGMQNYQGQRQLAVQDQIRQQQAQWQNDYRQQMAQNGANRNDNTLAVAQLRSADANAKTQQALQIAMMRVAAGHMSGAEGERTYVQELQRQGYSLPDAIEAAKGFAGRASRAQQGLDLRGDALDAMTQYHQWQMTHGDASLQETQRAHDWAISHGLTEEQIQQNNAAGATTGRPQPRVAPTVIAPRAAPAAAPSYVEGGTYTDAAGNKAVYRGGQFQAVP
jgi:hypothetical protein